MKLLRPVKSDCEYVSVIFLFPPTAVIKVGQGKPPLFSIAPKSGLVPLGLGLLLPKKSKDDFDILRPKPIAFELLFNFNP